MKYISLVIPITLIALVVYSVVKKIKIYDSFAVGAGKALPLIFSIFPYLVTVFIMTEMFKVSGITPLVILKPFSGGGSLAVLSEIFEKYGVDSYISLCASAVYGSSETTFYVSAVYFSKAKEKRLKKPILISLFSTFVSTVFACFICRFF